MGRHGTAPVPGAAPGSVLRGRLGDHRGRGPLAPGHPASVVRVDRPGGPRHEPGPRGHRGKQVGPPPESALHRSGSRDGGARAIVPRGVAADVRENREERRAGVPAPRGAHRGPRGEGPPLDRHRGPRSPETTSHGDPARPVSRLPANRRGCLLAHSMYRNASAGGIFDARTAGDAVAATVAPRAIAAMTDRFTHGTTNVAKSAKNTE